MRTSTDQKALTYVDGAWHAGNVPLAGPLTHAFWLGSTVFDGARWFEGVTPDLDLHCARANASALTLALKPTFSSAEIADLAREGLKQFSGETPVYIRPGYWAEDGDMSVVPADPESTRFYLALVEMPMGMPGEFSLTVSPFRRPTVETMPTDGKVGCLYPNNARVIREARARGFHNALVLDLLGNVAETATTNVFLVKDGIVRTPVANRCFLAGITRNRVSQLLRYSGIPVFESTLTVEDFRSADEIFTTGNHSKVLPVSRFESRELEYGKIARQARALYWEWAHSSP